MKQLEFSEFGNWWVKGADVASIELAAHCRSYFLPHHSCRYIGDVPCEYRSSFWTLETPVNIIEHFNNLVPCWGFGPVPGRRHNCCLATCSYRHQISILSISVYSTRAHVTEIRAYRSSGFAFCNMETSAFPTLPLLFMYVLHLA